MKALLIIFAGIITSFYYFPIEFTFAPGINTKLILAAFGIPIFGYHLIKMRGIYLSKEIICASCIALTFSFIGYFSVDFNNTTDFSYSTYIFSMWIWLIASYSVCTLISKVHNYLSIKLILNYLIAVCLFQCIIALCIDFNPSVKSFVDDYFISGNLAFFEHSKRLYGIGAALDVAGGKFSAVLMLLIVTLCNDKEIYSNRIYTLIYIFSFFTICLIGNMIGRSTSLGMLISISYLLLYQKNGLSLNIQNIKLWQTITLATTISIAFAIYFYKTDKNFYALMRFGFEGFFNWIEKGSWETNSTEILKNMWIYPDNVKTWLIGDGYFTDPNNPEMYYMRTDVGYLRFIFYCGLLGLFTFSTYFIYLSYTLWYKFSNIKHYFGLLLLLVFINWIKVSTDFFIIYALFLSVGSPYLYNKYYIKS